MWIRRRVLLGLLLPGASQAKRSNMIHADHAAIFYLKLQCYINKKSTPHKKIKLIYPSMFKPGKSPAGGFNGKIIQVHDGLKQLQCLIIGGHRKPLSFQLFIETSLHPTLGNESYSWSTHVSSFLMLENSPLWCLKTCETGWWQWSARGALKSTLFLEDLGDMVRCSWLPQVATVPSYSSVSCKIRGAQLTPGNKLWMIPQEG